MHTTTFIRIVVVYNEFHSELAWSFRTPLLFWNSVAHNQSDWNLAAASHAPPSWALATGRILRGRQHPFLVDEPRKRVFSCRIQNIDPLSIWTTVSNRTFLVDLFVGDLFGWLSLCSICRYSWFYDFACLLVPRDSSTARIPLCWIDFIGGSNHLQKKKRCRFLADFLNRYGNLRQTCSTFQQCFSEISFHITLINISNIAWNSERNPIKHWRNSEKNSAFLKLDEITPKIFKRKELCRSPTKFNAKNLECWRDRDGTILQNNFE